MRIGKITNTLVSLYNNEHTRKRAVFLIGASGIGKSQVVYQSAETLDIPVVDLRLAQCDPVDLRGVPSVVDGKTVWHEPVFFPDKATNPAGILFLDELTSAPPAVQAVAYQLILDRKVGDYELPDGWMVVAAGNRANDRGVTFQMAAPLLNRMTQLEVETTLDDWRAHAAGAGVRPEILAFLTERADYLHKFDKETYGQQFPSPRGWFAVSDVLNMDFDDATRVELIKGAVGHEAAVGLETFLRVWQTMPSLEAIFTNPDSVEVPADLNLRYCVVMGLAARMDRNNFNNAYSFLKRMGREFQTLAVKLAYSRDQSISRATKFSEFAIDNADAWKRGN